MLFSEVLGGFQGVPFVEFFLKYKLDTPSHIRSHCAKFHDPSYLGTPSKCDDDRQTDRVTEGIVRIYKRD